MNINAIRKLVSSKCEILVVFLKKKHYLQSSLNSEYDVEICLNNITLRVMKKLG